MQTVKVTVNVFDQSGVPIAGARVMALLTGTEVAQGYVLPVRGDVVANADGVAVLELFPNAAGATQSMYLFRIQEPKTGRVTEISATIPAVDCYLHEVANLPPYEGKRDGQLAVDAAVSALGQIRGIALQVSDLARLVNQKADATAIDHAAVIQLAGQVQSDKSATEAALQSAQQAAQVATDNANVATQKAVATASDRDVIGVLAGQVQSDKAAVGTALTSAQQAAQVATDQANISTQKSIAVSAVNDAVNQTAAAVATNKTATDTNLTASQLALQNAQVKAGIATTKAAESVSARDQSVAARDLSVAAWAASMTPAETLPAISKLMHSGAVVKTFIYDTSKDSDGGQWRKRCQDKSWYKESINGVWLGQAASELAARGDNLFASPDDMTNANWWAAGASVGGASMNKMSNDGTVRMQKVVDSAVNTSHQVYQNLSSQPQATTLAVQYTLLKGELTKVRLFFGGAGFSNTPQASVDLVAGTVTPSRGAYASIVSDSVTGGYIVTMWAQTTAAGACTCGMGLMNAAAASTYAGDGVSGIYVANPKLLYPGKLTSTYVSSPELLTNGVFANNSTAGWAQSSSWGATATAAAGEMQVTTTASSGRMVIPIQCTVGAIYTLTATLRVISGNQAAIGASTLANGSSINTSGWLFNTGASPLTATTTFIATAATMYIAAGDNNAQVVGVVNGFSGISVKQVTQVITPYIPYSAQVGQYYQSTADGKFYVLGQAYGAAETLRGNVRDFPEQVAVIVEASRVVIYDMTQPACPMWMVFSWALGGAFTSVVALNGALHVGCANGLIHYKFIADSTDFRQPGNYRTLQGLTPGNRLGAGTLGNVSGYGFIISIPVNDVTATVLENAPIDPSTGLSVPTIVVATNGGVSIIKQDGTVTNWLTTKGYIRTAYINKQGGIAATGGETVAWSSFFKNALPSGTTDNTFDYVFDGSSIPTRLGLNSSNGGVNNLISAGSHRAMCSSQAGISGVTLMKDSPAAPTTSMIAYINAAFNSGWMVGDIRGAWLADIVAESLVSSELVTTPDFSSSAGWTLENGWVISGGTLQYNGTGGAMYYKAKTTINTVVGKTYKVTFVVSSISGASVMAQAMDAAQTVVISQTGTFSAAGTYTLAFTANAAQTLICVQENTAAMTMTVTNVSCKLIDADRSVKNNGLSIVGTVAKTAAVTGANLVWYAGFSGSNSNYLEQPYNAALDFGAGDFSVSWWEYNATANNQTYRFSRGTIGVAPTMCMYTGSDFFYRLTIGGTSINTGVLQVVGIHKIDVVRSAGILTFYLDGVAIYSVANTSNVSNATAVLRVGTDTNTALWAGCYMALFRVSATAPSADQIAKMYADELPLFQPNAQCTIDGTTSAVTAIGYDDTTDLLHVGTNWGRSTFRGLARVESEATTVGALASISANQGTRLLGGATGCRAYQPAMLLRDELRREETARRALGQRPQFFNFDAIAAQTAFVVPKGYTAKAVYSAGLLQREGSTKSYTRSYDGFSEMINFAVAPGAEVWVSLMCVRNV